MLNIIIIDLFLSQEYKELTDDEYISLVQNFEKLTLIELGKYPLNNNIIINLLSLY